MRAVHEPCEGELVAPPPALPSCEDVCDAGHDCGICLALVPSDACLTVEEYSDATICSADVAPGDFCAGAGTCGTDAAAGNCGDLTIYGTPRPAHPLPRVRCPSRRPPRQRL